MDRNKPVVLELRPHYGVHPVRIGMTREEAGLALTELGTPLPFTRGQREPVGWRVAEGDLHLFVYCDAAGRVDGIELARPGFPGEQSHVQVVFQGMDVFGTKALDLLDALVARGIRVSEIDDYYPTAPELALGFSRDGDDHGYVAADGRPAYLESVLVAAPGYFE